MVHKEIRDRYFNIFKSYVHKNDEKHLLEIADFGRELLHSGVHIEDLVEIHEESLQRLKRLLKIKVFDSNLLHHAKTLLMEMLMGHSLELRRLYEHEKSADEKIRKLSNAVEQSPCTVIITDTKGNIEYVNPKFYQLTGYTVEEVIGKTPSLLKSGKTSHEEYKRLWETITSGSEWRGILCNKKKSSEYYWESISISPIKDLKGTITNFIAVKEDITERKIADERIKASLKEKEVLLKEIHHRVKNNMQIMASLLRLQSEEIKDKHLLDLFEESRNRIKSMALIHEDLYSGKDLASIDFGQYTRKLTGRLVKSFGVDPNRIITSVNIDNVLLGVDKAIPCGLIINELFTNSLKYAFPHIITDVEHIPEEYEDRERSKNKGEICINFHSNNDKYTLVFSDNGVGLPEDIDFYKAETMGLDLVRTLVKQLGGNIELNRNNGTEFKITFRV